MVGFPYGDESIDVFCNCEHEVARMKAITNRDAGAVFSEAFSNPAGSRGLVDFLDSHERVLAIVPDATRIAPSPRVFDALSVTARTHKLTFLVATGSHRPPTEPELRSIFGRFYGAFCGRTQIHKSMERDNMTAIGTTSRGTPVRLNRAIEKVDGIIAIGNVKPHYFAGFTGGRKSFLPGIAAYETIEANHSHAVSEDAGPMKLEGNPVHEDMVEAASLVEKDVFSIQTVTGPDGSVGAAFTGNMAETFGLAVRYARDIYSVPLRKMGNIVLTANPHPMDINLYQAQHAIENGRLVVEDGGILILVSKCWDGIGNDDFLKAFDRVDSAEDVGRMLGGGYRLGFHKVARVINMLSKIRLWAVTGLEPDTIRRARMVPFSSIQLALDTAIENMKANNAEPRVILMPEGGLTTPRPR